MAPTIPTPTGAHASSARTSWHYIWSMAWPIFLANVTIPLVGAVDTAMMGRFPDPAYIGGVALGSLVFSFLYFGLGFLRMCTTGLVAQAHGRGDNVAIENLLIRGLLIAVGLGVLLILIVPAIHWAANLLLTASDTVEGLMHRYIEIRIFAAPAALGNLVLLGCLFGRQQMRLCMVQIMVVNMGNVVFNYWFVFGLGLKIEGVAWASVVAQWLGFGFTLILIRWQWHDILNGIARRFFASNPTWLDLSSFRQFFKLGLDLLLRTMMLLGCEAILLNAAATYGDMELAVAQLVMVVVGFIAYGLDGYAHAAEALVGDAIGQKDPDMLRQVVRRSNWMAFGSALLVGLVLLVAETPILLMLTNQLVLVELAGHYWHWVAVMPIASFLAFQMDGVFVGATLTREMRNAMVASMLVFMGLVWLVEPYGLAGLLAAFTVLLGARGVSLWLFMPRVYRLAQNSGQDSNQR